jgi:putative NADH-flavin reductase
MKIAIIGATRGIGFEFLNYAVDKGHKVTALVRNPLKLGIRSDLNIVTGDILDYSSVLKAVTDQDIVCTSIGINITRKPVEVFSKGIKNVIWAMEKEGVENLISVTGIGTGNSKGHGGFLYDKIFNPLFLKTIYEDKDREEKLIRASSLYWTIVRPGFLTNNPMTGKYQALSKLDGVKCGKISRKDVAHFILEEAIKPKFLYNTPLLFY